MRYRSKVDWWIFLSIACVPIGITIAIIASHQLLIGVIGVVVVAIIAALCYPCDYTFDADQLVIRSGIMKLRVPYREIQRIDQPETP